MPLTLLDTPKNIFKKIQQVVDDDDNKKYKYVKKNDALLYAKFIGHLFLQEKLNKPYAVADLTFGSGNLTSRIVLDNNLQSNINILLLNDSGSNAFEGIASFFNKVEIKKFDILQALPHSEEEPISKFDCLIFNPLIVKGNRNGSSNGAFDVSRIGDVFYNNLDLLTNDDSFIILLGYRNTLESNFKKLFEKYKTRFDLSVKSKLNCIVLKRSDAISECFFEWDQNKNAFVEKKSIKRDPNVSEFCEIDIESKKLQDSIFRNTLNDLFFVNTENTENIDFSHKAILFQGVPGTGKSRAVNAIIKNCLKLSPKDSDNILRISVHSATTNSDLMQGIEVSTKNGDVMYSEKTGLILNHILKACRFPNQPFALVLEEIQENSLNELLGDLIYLLEDCKRADLSKLTKDRTFLALDYFDLIEQYIRADTTLNYVNIPNLISGGTFRKILMPKNFYIFCTSNYRHNKKVIEDNLFRRFTTIELNPDPKCIDNENVRIFFKRMNESIFDTLAQEEHPDRFMIGHAEWLGVNDETSFARALHKSYIELRDVRGVLGADLDSIFSELKKFDSHADFIKKVLSDIPNNRQEMAILLQNKAYTDILDSIKNFADS